MYIEDLPDKLCEWLSDLYVMKDFAFTTSYPSSSKTTPLVQPVIVIGAGDMAVYSNEATSDGSVINSDRVADEIVKISIHSPRSDGGNMCVKIMAQITDLLLFNSNLNIKSVKSTELEYTRSTDSLCLSTEFTLSEILTKGTAYPSPFVYQK